MKNKFPFTIAIEGMIGSGKSYTAAKLKEHLGEGALVLSTAPFIIINRNEWKERVEKGGILLKEWWDLRKIQGVLERIRKKEKFTLQGLYNLSNGQFTKEIDIDARFCNFLIFEGSFSFDETFKELVDFRLFLDTPEEISLKSAEKRDKTVRNMTHEQWVLKKTIFYNNYLSYLRDRKKNVDLVFSPRNTENWVDLFTLIVERKQKLRHLEL